MKTKIVGALLPLGLVIGLSGFSAQNKNLSEPCSFIPEMVDMPGVKTPEPVVAYGYTFYVQSPRLMDILEVSDRLRMECPKTEFTVQNFGFTIKRDPTSTKVISVTTKP